MKVWRADVRSQEVGSEFVPKAWERLGGRGLIARILLDEVAADCEPLGPSNKLIFAPGLLVGHKISSCDRISIGAKSPLTGGVKESNAGGSTGLMLTHLGMKALVIEGQRHQEGWFVLLLSAEGGRFEAADDLIGLGVYETAKKLLERYGSNVGLALIGKGGEMGLRSAGIQNLDKDREPSRIAARGGLGAVMGSKRLKAIVIDSSHGAPPPIDNQELFRQAKANYTKELMDHPQTKAYAEFGTAGMVNLCNHIGGMPTRGFSSGSFENAEAISGEAMRDLLVERGGEGKTTHACMAGCTIQCSNIFADQEGNKVVSPLEYETIGLVGSNLGLDDLDSIAALNRELNDLGLDTIEIGVALGVAAEAGLMEYGDSGRALELVQEIREGTELGIALGHGAVAAARKLGVERIPATKGQAMSAYDPRTIKGTGVTYATSPQGADHTAGLTIRAKVDHLDPVPQAELSLNSQINMAGYDSLGVCLFGTFGFATAAGAIGDLITALYGWDLGEDPLQTLGRETLKHERAFNKAAGFGPEDDRIPEWMKREGLPPRDSVFDVPDEVLDSLFDQL
ncbi:MAG: aldehyde ferredoxin oxidoreductase C-terminal domain-containing protein [Anaerolineae bacterium]|nr:MAG: aldehyde ferredoxin oxidoreductase C-terminal domain-containing protein [Anaerolineae bacterium]